jgi:malate synthase
MATMAGKIDVRGTVAAGAEEVITDDALDFLARLHRQFDARRLDLLARRRERQARFDMDGTLDFRPETRDIRDDDWQVARAPAPLERRRVEITGPTDAKTVINGINSGADGYMADFEDANSPTWANMVLGQRNLVEAIGGRLTHDDPEKGEYRLGEELATLHVRPRGWHLDEKHLIMDGRSLSGSLVDAGLFLFHNAHRLLEKGAGPYLYLPKLEGFFEARLWEDVLRSAEDELGLERGTVAVTVLIETVPAAFEMEEILYELRERPAALNAGRWDYIFSMIKCFREREEFILPDRARVTMTVPFMRAYTELLVATCHRRGAHAMGGMAAFLPSRTDHEANERAEEKLREDKAREAGDGFDGTWVAHPDFVRPAAEEFEKVLGERPNQVDRQRDDVDVSAADLLDASSAGGAEGITEEGLRSDVNVALQYVSSWLRGNGAAAIHGLMEDSATAEIARAQVWQWRHHGCRLDGEREVATDLVREVTGEELERFREEVDDDDWFERHGRPDDTRAVFEEVALGADFVDFLTLVAYERLP